MTVRDPEFWRKQGAALAQIGENMRRVTAAFLKGAYLAPVDGADGALHSLERERDYWRDLNGKLRDRVLILPERWQQYLEEALAGGDAARDIVDELHAATELIDSWKAPHPPKSESDWYPVSRQEILGLRSALAERADEARRWRSTANLRLLDAQRTRRQLAEQAEETERVRRALHQHFGVAAVLRTRIDRARGACDVAAPEELTNAERIGFERAQQAIAAVLDADITVAEARQQLAGDSP